MVVVVVCRNTLRDPVPNMRRDAFVYQHSYFRRGGLWGFCCAAFLIEHFYVLGNGRRRAAQRMEKRGKEPKCTSAQEGARRGKKCEGHAVVCVVWGAFCMPPMPPLFLFRKQDSGAFYFAQVRGMISG